MRMIRAIKDDLLAGIILGIFASVLTAIPGMGAFGMLLGVIGFLKSAKALQRGKLLGILGVVLNLFPLVTLIGFIFAIWHLFIAPFLAAG